MAALTYLETGGPPNSPPTMTLLSMIIMKSITATIKKIMTENEMSPAGTLYGLPVANSWYKVATTHGSPSPKKTLTELDPVTLPIEASANSSCLAAVIEAKVSGREVPKATNVIAVTDSLMFNTHPRTVAISPITYVTAPIIIKEQTKHGYPPP